MWRLDPDLQLITKFKAEKIGRQGVCKGMYYVIDCLEEIKYAVLLKCYLRPLLDYKVF